MAAGNSTKEGGESSSGIMSVPQVDFVDDVDKFMADAENDNDAQAVLKRLEEIYSKLKSIELSNVSTKRKLKGQILEFDKTLKMLKELQRRKVDNQDMTTQFRLADHVFVTAKVPPAEKIGLWLGANVMLEYSLDEGDSLLTEKKEKAETSLKTTNELIDTVRENITTLEVNMARIYNWDVKRRQAEKEKALGKSSS